MEPIIHQADPLLDLELETVVDLPLETIWAAWTVEEHITHWFTPAPWQTVSCQIDLRPGGAFRTVMRSPEGQDFPNQGCFLEIVPNRKLVWTNALQPGYRPAGQLSSEHPCDTFFFTAVISLEACGSGTRYRALVIHQDREGAQKHREMGFHEGWSMALEQLVAYMKALR